MKSPKASTSKLKRKERISTSDSGGNDKNSSEPEDSAYKQIINKPQESVYQNYQNFNSSDDTTSAKLSKYFETYKNLTKLKPTSDVKPKLSKRAIYLMQIPRGLNYNVLVNKEISLIDKTKLRLDGQKYIFTPLKEQLQPLSLLTSANGKCRIKKRSVHGSIKVHRNFTHKSKHTLDMSTSKVEFPAEIKVRHPIFGDKYAEEIKLDNSIQRKLNETVDLFNDHKKKKKKKRDDEEQKHEDEMIFQILENTTHMLQSDDSSKKKRKKKHKDREIMDSSIDQITHNGTLENSDEETVPESFKSYKKLKTHATLADTAENSLQVDSPHSRKEKKNDKRKEDKTGLYESVNCLIDKYCSSIEDDNSESPKKKKKKKDKRKSGKDEMFEPVPEGEEEEQTIVSSKKKKKRKNKEHDGNEIPDKNEPDDHVDIRNEILQDISFSLGISKKKKKKKRCNE